MQSVVIAVSSLGFSGLPQGFHQTTICLSKEIAGLKVGRPQLEGQFQIIFES